MKKFYILFNPFAGNGINQNCLKELVDSLEGEAVLTDMTSIEDYGDFLANIDKDDAIVVCGGDGTVNRFINDSRDAKSENDIFYYALGTGNDFLKDIEGEAKKLVQINKYIASLPTVVINGKEYKFVNNVGFGIDGYCCQVGDELKAKGKKNISYTGIAIKGLLFKFKPANAVVTVDGVKHEYKKVWLAPTMNGRFYGGGMMPTPKQDRLNQDGNLSVMIWHGSGKLATLMAFPSLFKGEHVNKTKYIEVLEGKSITVEFDKPCAVQFDGETIVGVTKYEAKARTVCHISSDEPLVAQG